LIEHVIFASGGNDSVALCQWAHENGYQNVAVAYSNTGWAAQWWPLRMVKFKAWVESLGFAYHEIPSEGMEALVDRKKGWPANRPKFCTYELKIKPAQAWLEAIDPCKDATCMVGVRREESAERLSWPLWIESSPNHGDRSLFSPLAPFTEPERDALIIRAGWTPLPHRSKECSPCVNANRADFRLMDEADIAKVERKEASSKRNMFRPYRFMNARGIRQVIKWAWSKRGKFVPEQSGCDSGMCGG
jgi:3'-phosphoadenosine 5'-phosphosulfate sulfotransferase (PAPS reductase)/FAD synthetase